jgi:hypothetical protein
MPTDHRASRRVAADPGFVVSATCPDFDVPYNLARRLVDLSPSGACVETIGRLREKLSLVVDVLAPKDHARFKAEGVVRWSTSPDGRRNLAGVKFQRILVHYGEKLSFLAGAVPDTSPARTREPRRRAKRFSPAKSELTCTPRDAWSVIGLRRDVALRLRDLGLGGAQIVCARKLKAGSRVSLAFEFQRPPARFEVEGEVVWSRRDTVSWEAQWLAGVRFLPMSVADADALRSVDKFYLG